MVGTFNLRQDGSTRSGCYDILDVKVDLLEQGQWIARYSTATMAEPLKAPVDWVIGETLLTEWFLLDLQDARGWFVAGHPEPEAGYIHDLFDGTGVTCSVQRPGASLAQQNHTDRQAAAAWMRKKLG